MTSVCERVDDRRVWLYGSYDKRYNVKAVFGSGPEMTLPKWFVLATEVSPKISGVLFGAREGVYEREASERGVSAQSLRRAIAAREFVLDFAQRHSIDLSRSSLNSVEEVRRWTEYDPGGAITAAKRLEQKKISVRRLREDERAARARYKSDIAIKGDQLVGPTYVESKDIYIRVYGDLIKNRSIQNIFNKAPDASQPIADFYVLNDDNAYDYVFVSKRFVKNDLNENNLKSKILMAYAVCAIFGRVYIYVDDFSMYQNAVDWAQMHDKIYSLMRAGHIIVLIAPPSQEIEISI